MKTVTDLPIFYKISARSPGKLYSDKPKVKTAESLSGHKPGPITARLSGAGLKSWPPAATSFEGYFALRNDLADAVVAAGLASAILLPLSVSITESQHIQKLPCLGYRWLFARPGMDLIHDESYGHWTPRLIPIVESWSGEDFFGVRNHQSLQIFCTRPIVRILIRAGMTSKELSVFPMDLQTSGWRPPCGGYVPPFDEALPKKSGRHRKAPRLYPEGYPEAPANLGPACEEDHEVGLV